MLPVVLLGTRKPMGVLVIGVNPYWRPDEAYTAFAAMAARQLGVMITDAVSYQNERKRQQALAELDRARTEFFQNISHELRAPLTMLLTPLQDILDEPGVVLPAAARDTVESSIRAADRLQRVVDALLDISRAESGALIPDREDIDLTSVTAELVERLPASHRRTAQPTRRRADGTAQGVRRPYDVGHHREQPGEQRTEVHPRWRGRGEPERRRQPGGADRC